MYVLDEINLRVGAFVRDLVQVLLHAVESAGGGVRRVSMVFLYSFFFLIFRSLPCLARAREWNEILQSRPDSLEKLLLGACGILVPDHVVHNDLDDLLRFDPSVGVVARLHLPNLGPVVYLFFFFHAGSARVYLFFFSFLFLSSSFFFFFFLLHTDSSSHGGVHTRSTSASVSRSSNSASWLSDSWYFPGGAI